MARYQVTLTATALIDTEASEIADGEAAVVGYAHELLDNGALHMEADCVPVGAGPKVVYESRGRGRVVAGTFAKEGSRHWRSTARYSEEILWLTPGGSYVLESCSIPEDHPDPSKFAPRYSLRSRDAADAWFARHGYTREVTEL